MHHLNCQPADWGLWGAHVHCWGQQDPVLHSAVLWTLEAQQLTGMSWLIDWCHLQMLGVSVKSKVSRKLIAHHIQVAQAMSSVLGLLAQQGAVVHSKWEWTLCDQTGKTCGTFAEALVLCLFTAKPSGNQSDEHFHSGELRVPAITESLIIWKYIPVS